MTAQEAREAIEEIKAQGFDEEEIVSTFYQMFIDDKLTLEEFGNLLEIMGYELTEEFLNLSPEDQKTKGWEDDNDEDIDEDDDLDIFDLLEKYIEEGKDEDEISSIFYQMFTEDKITLEDLADVLDEMGYELTEEFLNMSPEDQKTKGWEE